MCISKRPEHNPNLLSQPQFAFMHSHTAMLSVEDPSFFTGVTPVQFGGLPNLQESCMVVGYPIGGEDDPYSHANPTL